ncbi:MAG: VWA domain-containing protein [Puniceicoccaceae bacterium]|nr:MAG: VWA domain-containing protein [Puniceicoccaceae bacterium]
MKKRREAQSSALSFMDCICCGFGAVLLLFILTAKAQVLESESTATQSSEAAETLQAAIHETEAKQKALETQIEALDPRPDTKTTSLAQLAAEQERLAKAVEDKAQALKAIEAQEPTDQIAGLDRPSADRNYLSGLQLRGPKVAILLESSGSMLAENAQDALEIIQQGGGASSKKWDRAKAALRAVLASIPKGTDVAVFSMGPETEAISGNPQNPYFDPYDNAALLSFLERLDNLEARGGANLAHGIQTVSQLQQRASSLLLIADGLPTAPAQPNTLLSEADRVGLFNRATANVPNAPFNTILLPFEGDPSAVGLFWLLSARTGGTTLVPDKDWPSL